MSFVRGALEGAAGGLVEMFREGAQRLVALTLEGTVAGPVRGLGRRRGQRRAEKDARGDGADQEGGPRSERHQYIPPPPGIPAGALSPSSWISQMVASVVSSSAAMDAAFCKAERTTLVGSMTPASTRFSYFSVRALNPSSAFSSRTLATTTAPSC